jgi:hypothetical protein
MQVSVYKDYLAVRFIRCLTPIPNSPDNAGGAGFTLGQALRKCQSEVVEREFEGTELRPAGVRPLGIAAHPVEEQARKRATQEAVETLCLRQIQADEKFNCLLLCRLPGFRVGIARTSHGYFSMIVGVMAGQRIAAHSTHPSFIGTLLKVWEEYRSILFFRPSGERLKHYTKANFRFSATELKSLPFKFQPTYVYRPQLLGLKIASAERSGKHIAYLY